MGLNFYDYPGFQPKIKPAQRYATQCIPKRSVFRDIDRKTMYFTMCIMSYLKDYEVMQTTHYHKISISLFWEIVF